MSYIPFIIKSGKRFFSKQKVKCLLITKNNVEKITEKNFVNVNKWNIDMTFKVT